MHLRSIFALVSCLAAQASISAAACAPVQPAKKDDYTVTLNLFADQGCCSLSQTMSIGVIGKCHKTNQAFTSFTQAVGQNLFGRDLHIGLFNTENCYQEGLDYGVWYKLTNNNVCYPQAFFGYNSIVLSTIPN